MTEKDLIKKHEELKQLSISSYHPELKEYRRLGYSFLYDHSNSNTGFYAMVFRKDSEIVIVFRGTDNFLSPDRKDDLDMFNKKIPAQSNDAMDLYVKAKEYCRNNRLRLIVTGHSLGGSLAQILGAITGTEAVTFNAYGTKDLLPEYLKTKTNNITNYCLRNDIVVARLNAENHIGKCYVVPSTKGNVHHSIEYMDSLEKRREIQPSELSLSAPAKHRIHQTQQKNYKCKKYNFRLC